MQDIPEAEARALLQKLRICEDFPEWAPIRLQPGSFEIAAGVVDEDGKGSGLLVQLLYQHSFKTQIKKYKCSVFQRQAYGLDRVYQLQVNHFTRPIRNPHHKSHQHIGDFRDLGDASWANWSYDDVISFFRSQTNITFDPELPHPENFKLKG
jgi:hypothetical protein